jgi:putative heme-binding domain-containing protein
LIEGQRGEIITPGKAAVEIISRFARFADPQVAARSQRLAALWGDAQALQQLLAKINDSSASEAERIQGLQTVRRSKTDAARTAMLGLLAGNNSDGIRIEALGGLSEAGGDAVPEVIIQHWKDFSPAVRRAAGDNLISRRNWALAFLEAIRQKLIAASDLPATTIRALLTSKDDYVRGNAARALGRYRAPGADKLKLIAEKRKVVLSGQPDINAGYEVARRVCFVCHKMHGEGAEVGPDLTGVGRSSLDALLHNVINPNELIGAGYENVEVETKDGRSLSGRMVENTDTRVKILSLGPVDTVIAKSDIAKLRVSEVSVMPEGLEQMPDADFRNLIWYILNPPQDKRPMTPALRRELIGEGESAGNPSAAVGAPLNAERKVALHSEKL